MFLTNAKVRGKIQGITLTSLDALLRRFQEVQDQVVGITTRIRGRLEGFILITINCDLVDHLLELVLTNYGSYIREEDLTIDLEEDMLKEIANIIIGSLTSEISSLLKIPVYYEVPLIAIDVVAVILDQLCTSLAVESMNALVFHISFELNEHKHFADIVLLLTPKGEHL